MSFPIHEFFFFFWPEVLGQSNPNQMRPTQMNIEHKMENSYKSEFENEKKKNFDEASSGLTFCEETPPAKHQKRIGLSSLINEISRYIHIYIYT